MVPNGWELKQLDEVCSKPISYGIVQTGEDIRNGIPCARVVDLTKNEFDICEMIKTTEEIHQSYKKTILEKGELMMALRGEIGLVRIVPEHLIGINITRGIARLAPKNNVVDSEYLLWIMRSNQVGNDLKRKAGGSALQEISLTALRKVKVAVPSLPEQRKIANILGTWDKAISTTERLIDNSKQQKKALMQQLLTGKKRLFDDSGKPFDSEWEEVKLSDVVSTGRGFAFKSTQYSESGYKIVRVTNVDSSGKIDLSDCVYIPDETACEYKKYELYENDVLLVMVGATAGKLGFVSKNTLPALLNQNMWSLRAKDSKRLCQLFLRHVIYQVVARYLLSQQGSARGFFTQKTFESVKFLIPPVFEQQKIASVLTNADEEIELLEQQLADLKQEKKALMQQLLTGKRRVKIEDVEVA